MNLVFGQDQAVANWVIQTRGNILPYNYAVGVVDDLGRLQGAATFHIYTGSSIELCYHGPNTLTKRLLKELLVNFCFEYIKVNRVTFTVPRKNKRLINHLQGFGVKVEGVLRHFYGPFKRDDGILFGILKEECTELFK